MRRSYSASQTAPAAERSFFKRYLYLLHLFIGGPFQRDGRLRATCRPRIRLAVSFSSILWRNLLAEQRGPGTVTIDHSHPNR